MAWTAEDCRDRRHAEREGRIAARARGYAANKKVEGRTRVLMVDVEGDSPGVRVVPANVQDRGALRTLSRTSPSRTSPPTRPSYRPGSIAASPAVGRRPSLEPVASRPRSSAPAAAKVSISRHLA